MTMTSKPRTLPSILICRACKEPFTPSNYAHIVSEKCRSCAAEDRAERAKQDRRKAS